MVVVAQLVRAPDCGSGGRGFKSHHPPQAGLLDIKLVYIFRRAFLFLWGRF